MAFNLMARKDVQVFYIVCGDVRENVQVGYSRRSSTFRRCVEQDMPTHLIDGTTFDILLIPHCLTFAFIWALLTGAAKFDRPRTRDEVCKALEARTDGSSKMHVFFLDDFPLSVKGENDSALQFMRNVFCSFGLPVIVSARIRSAANLVATEPARLGGYHALWCVVRPTIPPFQYLPQSPHLDSSLQEIVRYSRPSLSKLAVEYARANPFTEVMDFVEYMDAMAGALVLEYIGMTVTRSDFRSMEQMCLLLAASNSRGMLSSALEPGTTSYFVNANFARFHDTIAFTLHWGCSSVPVYDGDPSKTWQCLTEIPGPESDALLHLCFMGGKTAEPTTSSTIDTRISFRQTFESIYYESGASRSDDTENLFAPGTALEALAAGAIVAASRQNGFAGIAFPDFLSLLMYELGIQSSSNARVDLDAAVMELVAGLRVPFLAPLGVEWSDFLTRTSLNLGHLFDKRTDADRSSFSFMQDKITVECNTCWNQLTPDFILGTFTRIPAASLVHLVILTSLQSLYFFRADALESGRDGPLQNTLFYRVQSCRHPQLCAKLRTCRYIQDKSRTAKKINCHRVVIFMELPEIND